MQQQRKGESLASDLEGPEPTWEHRMLSVCGEMCLTETVGRNQVRVEKQMFSVQTSCSDAPCRLPALEAAFLLGEE